MPLIPPDERRAKLREVELGYTLDDVMTEAGRCLECGCTALFQCDLRRYRHGVPGPSSSPSPVRRTSISGRQPPPHRARPQQVHPVRALPSGCAARSWGWRVRVHQPRVRDRGSVPRWEDRLLDTDCVSCGLVHRHLPDRLRSPPKLPLAKPGPWEKHRGSFGLPLLLAWRCQLNYGGVTATL